MFQLEVNCRLATITTKGWFLASFLHSPRVDLKHEYVTFGDYFDVDRELETGLKWFRERYGDLVSGGEAEAKKL
jgi:hypothetical protein